MKAIWKDTLLAESDDTIVVESNHYFPPDSIKKDFFQPSDSRSSCHWKGEASYYSIKIGDELNEDSAWYYPAPKAEASNIKDYIAFWKGIEVIE